tara:strand:+ start:381 stop:1379 length:999 start_codon:yes stop_codon:yes gene_type:complete
MIDIIILTEEINTPYTLASLLDSDENFRLHLFNRRGKLIDNMEPTISWAMKNFREVYSYQTPFMWRGEGSNRLARTILQFKEHWKDKQPKGFPIERVIVHTRGARIFNGSFKQNVPTVRQMGDNLCYFSRCHQYFDHPFYGNYYQTIGLEAKKTDYEEDFILLNWTKFKDLHWSHYFQNGKPTRVIDVEAQEKGVNKYLTDKDSFILSAKTPVLMRNLITRKHGIMPLYFDMGTDELIKKEAIGPKDTINHNIMVRKAFSASLSSKELYDEYHMYPTLPFMAVPWDMWTKVIDNIPLNIRRDGINERLLLKADKQKKYLRKVVEAGYLLGKI